MVGKKSAPGQVKAGAAVKRFVCLKSELAELVGTVAQRYAEWLNFGMRLDVRTVKIGSLRHLEWWCCYFEKLKKAPADLPDDDLPTQDESEGFFESLDGFHIPYSWIKFQKKQENGKQK